MSEYEIRQAPGLPPQAQSEEDKTLGMLSHLLGILTGFLGPLILWLVKRESSPFIDHHGREALNFQISLILVSICFAAVGMVVFIVTFGFGIIILAPIWLAIWVIGLVWQIQACMAANSGKTYRYPFNIRFLA